MAACVSSGSDQVSVATRRAPSTTRIDAGKPTCWQHRLFGRQLARCGAGSGNRRDPTFLVREDADCRPVCETVAVYFSFVGPNATCDDFTRQLVELYASVNRATTADDNDVDDNDGNGRRFEVVHVVLWSNASDVLDYDESFRDHVADLPWLAVPNHDYERKVSVIVVQLLYTLLFVRRAPAGVEISLFLFCFFFLFVASSLRSNPSAVRTSTARPARSIAEKFKSFRFSR